MTLVKDKRLGRVTMYGNEAGDGIDRVEVDFKTRWSDNVTGKPDPDGDWVNKSLNYSGEDSPPQVIINAVKARLGIT